jgi:hypothetical protein
MDLKLHYSNNFKYLKLKKVLYGSDIMSQRVIFGLRARLKKRILNFNKIELRSTMKLGNKELDFNEQIVKSKICLLNTLIYLVKINTGDKEQRWPVPSYLL